MSLTTRERGAYIRVEKRVTNLGGLYSGELIHGGGLFTEFYGINLEAGDGLYADSIGREVPRDFEDTFSNFFQAIYKVYEKKKTL